MSSRRFFTGVVLLLLFGLPLLTGCDDETLTAPEIQDDLFNSYVSIGNSITAGFQSAGINSQTQSQSYAVLLAEQMNTPFGVPELRAPGCPPPLQSVPPQPPSVRCALRSPIASPIHNVAVPGAALSDVLSNQDPPGPPGPNQLTQFILGGRTQIEAALETNPTFATVWSGNNDVLVGANTGTPAFATSPSDFEARYRALADSLRNEAPLEGAVLIGVADVSAVPGIFPGQVYFELAQQVGDQLPDNFSVATTCRPNAQGGQGTTTQISLLFALDLINQARLNPGEQFTLSCGDTDPGALTPGELETLSNLAADYNETIGTIAGENGWAFYNPNGAFESLAEAGEIPQVPDFTSDQPFGQFFSLDGVHPSAATHRLLASQLVQVINDAYGTSLSPPENVPQLPTGGQ